MGIFSRKVVYSGSMNVDPALVRQWEEAAAISGRPLHIPGGASPTSYVKDQVKQWDKEAQAFRERISVEYAEMKKNKEKPDKKVAEKRAREWAKAKFKWKK
jgi:hypothetical protein